MGLSLALGLLLDTSVPRAPLPQLRTSVTPTQAGSNLSGVSIWDRTWTLDNSKTVTKIGVYSTTARTYSVQVVQRVGAGLYTVIATETLVHTGGGWQDKTLAAPVVIPASGTFYAALFYATGTINYSLLTPRGFNTAGGQMAGSNVACTEDIENTPGLRAALT